MAKQAAAPIERMAGQKPHKGRQLALEIVTFLLFVLFMIPTVLIGRRMNVLKMKAFAVNHIY